MDEESLMADPYSKSKKTTIAVLVTILGLLVIVAFLIFGKLLRDLLVFEANRSQANSELIDLDLRIKEKREQLNAQRKDFEEQLGKEKAELQQLDEAIAKREAQIDSRQKLVNEYNTSNEKAAAAKKEYQAALEELKIVRENTVDAKGAASGLKIEIAAFATQKSSLQNELAELGKTRKAVELSIAQLSDEITSLGKTKSAAQAEVSAAKKAVAEVSTNLTTQTTKVESAQKALSRLEEETGKIKATHDTLSSHLILSQETIKTKKVEKEELETIVTELTKRRAELSVTIAALEERKRDIETQVKASETKLEQAKTGLQTVKKETEAAKADK